MRRNWMVASALVLVCPMIAMAQHGGGVRAGGMVAARPGIIAASHSAASAPRGMVRGSTGLRPAATPIRRTRTAASSNRNVNGLSALNNLPVFSTSANVPGLGFDYPHLAAVSAGRGRGRSGFGQIGSFGFGGYLLSPGIVVENPQAVEEAAQSGPEEGPVTNAADSGDGPQREYFPRANSAAEPPKDDTEYVFVRRDGGLLFAVAYSFENGTLRYVTPDGLRKSVSQDSLDMDATQQFNEQRGLNFRVPA